MSKIEFPQFDDLTSEDIRQMLKHSRLSKTDRQIAISRLIWRMDYVDIGAAVYLDRTSVSRRMRHIIAPQLESLMKKNKTAAGA